MNATIYLSESNEKKIEDFLDIQLCANKHNKNFSIGEVRLMLLGVPDETKYFEDIIKALDTSEEHKEMLLNTEEIKFYRDKKISLDSYNLMLDIEIDDQSIVNYYIYVFTSYIAEVLWKKLRCEMFIVFDTHQDNSFYPFCQYSSANGKIFFTEYFKDFNDLDWIPNLAVLGK